MVAITVKYLKILKITRRTILHIALTAGALAMVFPFIWMFFNGFKTSAEINSFDISLLPRTWTLYNYKTVLETADIFRGYLNSLIVASCITFLTVFTATLVGFLFAKMQFKGKKLLFYMVVGSMMIPPQISMMALYIFASKAGLIDNYLGLIFPGIMGAFAIFLMRQFIVGIPDSLIDAAKIDGATDFIIYRKVILPLTKPIMSVIAILVFVWNWDSFLWPLIVVSSNEMQTLPLILSRFLIDSNIGVGPSMAATSIIVIPILVVYIFFQRNLIKSMALSGMKE